MRGSSLSAFAPRARRFFESVGWTPSARFGATLSEVLISLLVMSIGVVSLATLFPISVLRSVQATQLTNAANLRYNVEAMLSVLPQLYTIGKPWQAGVSYNVGDLVTPTELTSLKSPPVVFQCTAAGNSGTVEPSWNFIDLAPTNDGTATWQTYRLQNYVIDPLGQWAVESTYRSAANGNFFGNDGASPPNPRRFNGWGGTGVRAFPGIGTSGSIVRLDSPNAPSTIYGVVADDAVAANGAGLPDSWIAQAESNAVSYTAGSTTCTLADLQFDLAQTTPTIPQPSTPPNPAQIAIAQSRIVLFDSTGKISHTRPILNITGSAPTQIIHWTPPAFSPGSPPTGQIVLPQPPGSLPAGFAPVRARVETAERRYTWLLSVRRGYSGASFMDVVVFFRRPFSGKDEQVYPATFTSSTDPGYDGRPGIASVDDDGVNGTDDAGELGWPGSDDSPRNWVVVQYNSALGKPFVKKGGFVTDADNLRWYRILDVVEGDLIYPSTPTGVMAKAGLNTGSAYYTPDVMASGMTDAMLLRVEDKILQSGPAPSASGPAGGAMLMRGIVDVFPIRTHLTWEE